MLNKEIMKTSEDVIIWHSTGKKEWIELVCSNCNFTNRYLKEKLFLPNWYYICNQCNQKIESELK